jgi:hypothetical protein
MPAKAGSSHWLRKFIEDGGYWIGRIIKPVLGLAKPDPSVGR